MYQPNNTPPNIPIVPPPSRPRRGPGRWLVAGIFILVIGLSSALIIQNKVRQGALANPRVTIQITGDGFVPQMVTIKTGQAVRWTNSDSVEHTISQSETFGDKVLKRGDSFTAHFDTKGEYQYHDSRHSGWAAVIVE